MDSWSNIRLEFESLRDALRHNRIDYQWGAAGVYYRIAGGFNLMASRRFETLAAIAGSKLSEFPTGIIDNRVFLLDKPEERWYEALRYHSEGFQTSLAGEQINDDGTSAGHVYGGSLQEPAESSALLALRLSGISIIAKEALPSRKIGLKFNDWLNNEREKRGAFWGLAAFISMLVLTLLSL